MKINPIYKQIGSERRQYRKYAPWIFFISEGILTFEILYSMDLVVGIGNLFIIGFLGAMYFRLNKLFTVLDRNNRMKNKDNIMVKPSLY